MKHVFLSSVGEAPFFSFGVVELLDRQRLTCETALANEDVFRGQQPHVARNHIAGRQPDDVARYQIPQWDLSRRAVPNHGRGHMDHGLQFLCGGVRSRFLPEAESHAQRYHTHHHRAGTRVARKKRNGRQARKQNYERIADDFQNADDPALLPFLRDLIRTSTARAFFGIRLGQAIQRSSQVPQQLFAVLPGGIEDCWRNPNILVLRLG